MRRGRAAGGEAGTSRCFGATATTRSSDAAAQPARTARTARTAMIARRRVARRLPLSCAPRVPACRAAASRPLFICRYRFAIRYVTCGLRPMHNYGPCRTHECIPTNIRFHEHRRQRAPCVKAAQAHSSGAMAGVEGAILSQLQVCSKASPGRSRAGAALLPCPLLCPPCAWELRVCAPRAGSRGVARL
jgi:hypothetical protein